MEVYIDEATLKRLQHSALELDRDVGNLASAAIEEYVLNLYRDRDDDPAKRLG